MIAKTFFSNFLNHITVPGLKVRRASCQQQVVWMPVKAEKSVKKISIVSLENIQIPTREGISYSTPPSPPHDFPFFKAFF